MPVQTKTWDLQELNIIACGVPVSGGFADGQVCTIEHDEDDYVTKKGADGHVTLSKTYNQLAKVTIRLLQTAEVNAAFSALRLLGTKGRKGAAVGPLTIKDNNGTSLYFASDAWIMGPPKAVYSREDEMREWTFGCNGLEVFEAGT